MGVVSRGKGCSGIYTRVKKYLKWINRITKTRKIEVKVDSNGLNVLSNDSGKYHDHVDKQG